MSDIDFDKIKLLRAEIEKLLAERPQFKALQAEIDEKMKKAGSAHNRAALMQSIMLDSFFKMNESLQELKTEIEKPKEEEKPKKPSFKLVE